MLALTAVIGLMVGSFLNVVIHRTPMVLQRKWTSECREFLELPEEGPQQHFSVVWPGSRCTHCQAPITAWQNIPVLSYLILRGKCASCGASIGIRYPLVEIATAILTVLVALEFGIGWTGLGAMLLTWSLIALTGIDLDSQLLPDAICLPLLWLGLIANSFAAYTDTGSALWGAVAGYLLLWSVFQGFRLVTGRQGMGYGDFKLLAALGAWTGWQLLPMVILIASMTGLIAALLMIILLSHDRTAPSPLAPIWPWAAG